MSKEVSNRNGFGEKRLSAKNRVSDAQKISRATSVIIGEPALELILKTAFDERIIADARVGLTLLGCAFYPIIANRFSRLRAIVKITNPDFIMSRLAMLN